MCLSSGMRERFPLGQTVITPAALETVPPVEVLAALARHGRGDWGEIDPGDLGANEAALARGGRLFSVYGAASGVKFWVITEADRSSTTVLLPQDY